MRLSTPFFSHEGGERESAKGRERDASSRRFGLIKPYLFNGLLSYPKAWNRASYGCRMRRSIGAIAINHTQGSRRMSDARKWIIRVLPRAVYSLCHCGTARGNLMLEALERTTWGKPRVVIVRFRNALWLRGGRSVPLFAKFNVNAELETLEQSIKIWCPVGVINEMLIISYLATYENFIGFYIYFFPL